MFSGNAWLFSEKTDSEHLKYWRLSWKLEVEVEVELKTSKQWKSQIYHFSNCKQYGKNIINLSMYSILLYEIWIIFKGKLVYILLFIK